MLQCIINNYNLVNNLHVHILILVYLYNSNYIYFKQFIVFNNIKFNLNLIRILCYRIIIIIIIIKLYLYTDKSGTAAPFTGVYTH